MGTELSWHDLTFELFTWTCLRLYTGLAGVIHSYIGYWEYGLVTSCFWHSLHAPTDEDTGTVASVALTQSPWTLMHNRNQRLPSPESGSIRSNWRELQSPMSSSKYLTIWFVCHPTTFSVGAIVTIQRSRCSNFRFYLPLMKSVTGDDRVVSKVDLIQCYFAPHLCKGILSFYSTKTILLMWGLGYLCVES